MEAAYGAFTQLNVEAVGHAFTQNTMTKGTGVMFFLGLLLRVFWLTFVNCFFR